MVVEEEKAIEAGYAANTLRLYMAEAAVKQIAIGSASLTTDDVMAALEGGAHHTRVNRAMGLVMRTAHEKGYIRPTDRFVPSTNKRKHQSPTRVWESMIYDGRLF